MKAANKSEDLKEAVKAALVEVLDERQDLLREALSEALEDIGMLRAIEEGLKSWTSCPQGSIRRLKAKRMTVQFRKSFVKDLQALEPDYRPRVEKAIREIERAASLRELSQLKKLQGRSGFFRIRVGDYRLGLAVVSVRRSVRCLHRNACYRHFP